ncbi:PQQ-dependent sugar dehydrogenase [Paracoccus sanguinis]|uniref:Glucose/arabinose dehydrogenase, beta-propeller fold n=1 Tax=Paracoccus sanguinis TaxID=1545044 RepID=A0A099FZU3_9RHOB|nr:PQQ-dependent sugar dehydrogenase [Paracoccus sanguinis]KGJ16094.1 glucose dehydrogenase [Paracoccus sanguinis]KGJ19797.1 glucose dehydrogenase [Paracoccus sanguinis]SDX36594.1 Glucose/arabinose dehydrogenase, beta-propeller fold [Paracoccus sanguinis]
MARFAPSFLTTAAALGLMAGAALAQDFNAAPPNAPNQQPAFEGQTRAPVIADTVALKTETVVDGLSHPWALALLPDGAWLVTERPGRLRMVGADGTLSEPIAGLPEIDAKGQGGLLDVMVGPDFASDRRLWISYAAPAEGGNQTAVATAKLSADGRSLEEVKELFRQIPVYDGDKHFGSRLLLDGQGGLIVTLGERSDVPIRDSAQADDNHLGKIVRIDPLTGAPMGAGIGLPETHAKGFRNVQAAAFDKQGQLWTVEHGPKGGDELNHVEAGKNYGWPVITYGVAYSGADINAGKTAQEGMEQPVYYWDPVIAPSGMAFYDGAMFPDWNGSALIGALQAGGGVVRLTLDGGKVSGEARYLNGIGRVRDLAVAPDGALMLITDADNGAVIRVSKE